MKEVVSAMYIITTLSTEEIRNQNPYQMRSLDEFYLKNVDETFMITAIICSILYYPSTSDDDDVNTDNKILNEVNNTWQQVSTQFGKEGTKYKT